MKKIVLLSLILGSWTYSTGQPKIVDSLKAILKTKIADTSRVLVMADLVSYEYAVQTDSPRLMAEQALALAKKIKFKKGEAASYRVLGLTSWGVGDYDQASEYAFKMLRIYDSLKVQKGVISAYYLLGQIHHQWRDFDKAKSYYLQVLEANSKTENRKLDGYVLNSLAALYSDAAKRDSALYYNMKALAIREKINDEQGISQSLNNIGVVHSKLGNYALALEYLNRSIPLTKKVDNKIRMVYTIRALGETYFSMKEYNKANVYLVDALEQAKIFDDKMLLWEINETLEKLEEARGNYKQALAYERIKRGYQDSMFNQEKAKQLAEIETKFETEKKTQLINILEKDNKIKGLTQYMLVGLITITILGFVLIYAYQQIRNKENSKFLNLQIDYLTSQNKTLAEKYKVAMVPGTPINEESYDQRFIKKALEIVELNISNTLFGVEKLAEEMGMSRANLHKKLKSITGFAPSDFIRNVRLKRAASLLKNQTDSVSQIAYQVGFEDQSYFAKSFKKSFGVSPTEFTKKELESA
jgi:AraC-like DNA-binding protein/Tfp pilus assembly protein PilF